jgi:hypothetical protein
MYYGVCSRCTAVQPESWRPGVACAVCAGEVPGDVLCPACLSRNQLAAGSSPGECRQCSLLLPQEADWKKARALLTAGAERLTYRDRLREWPVATAVPLLERGDAQALGIRARLTGIAATLQPSFIGTGLLNELELALIASLPLTVDAFKATIESLPSLEGRDAATLDKVLELQQLPWQLRLLVAVAALKAGSSAPLARQMVGSYLPSWNDAADGRVGHVALEALATIAHWRVQAAWPHRGFGYSHDLASSPWAKLQTALLAHLFIEHPTSYAPWMQALCVVFLAHHDRRVKGDEDSEDGKRLAALRQDATRITTLAKASLAAAAEPERRDLRFTLALALGDEASLEALTHVADDASLRDAALRAYASYGGRLSSLRITRLKQSILAASVEEGVELIRQLPSTEDLQVVELAAAVIPVAHADVADAAWRKILHGVSFAKLDEAAQVRVLALFDDPIRSRLSRKAALTTFSWMVREMPFPYTGDARILKVIETCRAFVLEAPVDERRAVVDGEHGFSDWLAAAVAADRADFSSWAHDASDETLEQLLRQLESLEHRFELPRSAPPVTWPAVAALWSALPAVRRDAAAEVFRTRWLTRSLHRREGALRGFAERYAAHEGERFAVLNVVADDLDAFLTELERVGTPLFTEAPAFYRIAATIPAIQPYTLLQRVLTKVDAAGFATMLDAAFDVSRALFPRGATQAMPPLKLMMATAEKRLEELGDDPTAKLYDEALRRLEAGWQGLSRDAVAEGWPDTNGYYFESFTKEIHETLSRVERLAQKRVDAERHKAEQAAKAELKQLRDAQAEEEAQRRNERELEQQRAHAEEQAKIARAASRTMAAMAQRQVLTAKFQQDCAEVMASALDPAQKAARVAELARDLQAAMAALDKE